MKARAFQKIYCRLTNITKATCTLEATNVGYEEMAYVQGRAAQVVKIVGNKVTLQVFEGTEGLRNDAEIIFTGRAPWLPLSVITSYSIHYTKLYEILPFRCMKRSSISYRFKWRNRLDAANLGPT